MGLAVEKLGTRSIVYSLGLFREAGDDALELAARGRFVHVYVDGVTRRPVAIPPEIESAARTLVIGTASI